MHKDSCIAMLMTLGFQWGGERLIFVEVSYLEMRVTLRDHISGLLVAFSRLIYWHSTFTALAISRNKLALIENLWVNSNFCLHTTADWV